MTNPHYPPTLIEGLRAVYLQQQNSQYFWTVKYFKQSTYFELDISDILLVSSVPAKCLLQDNLKHGQEIRGKQALFKHTPPPQGPPTHPLVLESPLKSPKLSSLLVVSTSFCREAGFGIWLKQHGKNFEQHRKSLKKVS